LFIAITLTFLPERITSKRSGKILAVFIGLMMGFGLYKTTKFLNDFDMQVQKAIIYIKENQPQGAIHPIQTAKNHMNIVWDILKKMKHYENYLIDLSKKEEKSLKKEKRGK